jgi:hypothetical protein
LALPQAAQASIRIGADAASTAMMKMILRGIFTGS